MDHLTSIHFGDTVGFVNGSFALATPSFHDESIRERDAPVSGMRAICDYSVTAAGFQFPKDYADRCVFKILPDRNAISDNRGVDEVCFGSVIRLVHEPTGHVLISSNMDHKCAGTPTGKKIFCTFLRKELTREEEVASQWVVHSRYKLRREGDVVRVNDSIILKSLHFKECFLTVPDYFTDETVLKDSTLKSNLLPGPYFVGATSDSSKMSSSGWLIKRFQHKGSFNSSPSSDGEYDNNFVTTGSYVRVSHIESRGRMISRADDAKAVLSKIAPLGSIYRMQSGVRTDTHGVYMRCPHTSSSAIEDSDSLSVWQILPHITDGLDIFKKVRHGDLVRIRHLLSGQYLCIRPATATDAVVIREESSVSGKYTGSEKAAGSGAAAMSLKKPLSPDKQGSGSRSGSPLKTKNGEKSMTSTIIPFELFDITSSEQRKHDGLSAEEKHKIEYAAFIEKVKSNSSVATTSDADSSTLFSIFSCDLSKILPSDVPENDTSKKFISFQESIYFQHEKTTCRFKLYESSSTSTKSNPVVSKLEDVSADVMLEYEGDVPVKPCDPSESEASMLISVNANACQLEEINIEDVRDILFACRFGHLVRTAIQSVQNPSKNEGSTIPTNIYRELCSGLFTLSQWAVLKGSNEASLTEYSPLAALNRRVVSNPLQRRASMASMVSNSAVTDNSDDEDLETNSKSARGSFRARTLTVVERMDRAVYPALVDNSSYTNTFASLASGQPSVSTKSGQREVIDAVSRATVRRRQSLLCDCRLLEMSLHFANIVFTLVREQDSRLDELKYGVEDAALRKSRKSTGSAAPQVLIDCCRLVHEIIRSAISLDNRKNALKIISINGVLMSFMLHDVVGWNPTIEDILISARSAAATSEKEKAIVVHKKHGGEEGMVEKERRDDVIKLDKIAPHPATITDKLGFVSSENVTCMVKQMFDLKRKGDYRTSVNILRLLAVLCAPGEAADHYLQDVVTDAVFSSVPSTHGPQTPTPATQSRTQTYPTPAYNVDEFDLEPFQAFSGFLFASRLSADNIWQVRASTDMKHTEPPRASSLPLGDIRQEILERGLKSNKGGGAEEGNGGSENKVSKELLNDLLIDLGLVGVALQEGLTKLTGRSVSEVITWLEDRKHQDYVFSGLSHFTSASIDIIPTYRGGNIKGSVDGFGKGSVRASSTKGSVRGSVNGSARGSVRSANGSVSSAKGSVMGSHKGSVKNSLHNQPMRTIEKLKQNAYNDFIKTDKDGKLPNGQIQMKNHGQNGHDKKDKAHAADDEVLSWGCGTVNLSPVVELSDSSESPYSSSSPAVSDSEEENSDYEEEEIQRKIKSQRKLEVTPPVNRYKEEEEEYDDEYDEEEEQEELEEEVILRPLNRQPFLNTFHNNNKNQVEYDLDKIDEDEEGYDEDEENTDDGEKQPEGPALEWVDWTEALSDGSRTRLWLQRALNLVCELCRGNFRGQKKSSHFLPPELLLFLLQSGMLSQENRTLVCRLLRVIYVQNDFVFSSNSTGNTMDSAMTFGLSDSHYPLRHLDGVNDTVIEEDIGKLFNHHTKLTFSGCDSGVNLRAQLWWFLRSEILTLKVDFRSLAEEQQAVFSVSLLQLLRDLIERGFFDDSDSFFLVHKQEISNENQVGPRSCFQWLTKAKEVYGGQFDVEVIQRHVITVLEEWQHVHSSLKNINQKPEKSEHGTENTFQKNFAGFVQSSTNPPKQHDFDVNHVQDVNLYFNQAFANKLQCSILFEIVQILTEIFSISQKQLLRNITETLKHQILQASTNSGGDMSIGRSFVPSSSLLLKIDHLIDSTSIKDNNLVIPDKVGVTKALLIGTLHTDEALTSSIFKLLHQHISSETGVVALAADVTLVPTVKESLTIRHAQNYGNALLKRIKELTDRSVVISKDKKTFLTGTITSTFIYIRDLFSDKPFKITNEGGKYVEYNNQGSLKNTGLFSGNNPLVEKNKLKEKEKEMPGNGKRNMKDDKVSKSMKSECSYAGDDSLGMPATNIRLEKCMRYCTSNDSENSCKAFCYQLIDILTSICTTKAGANKLLQQTIQINNSKQKLKAWDNLLASEKFLVDEICNFLGDVGGGSPSVCSKWEVPLGAIAVQYWRVCDGSAQLLELLCLYCPFAGMLDNDQAYLLDSLMSKLLSSDKKPLPMVPRILCAILLYDKPSRLKTITLSGLLSSGLQRLIDSPQMSLATVQSSAQISAALHTIRLLALLGLRTSQLEFSTCVGASHSLREEACLSLLSTENTPLLIKCAVLQISVCLHDMSIPSIINVMLLDMNNIQTQLTVRTPKGQSHISRNPLGIKIPRGLQITESPFNSVKTVGQTELSFCKTTCAEHLFEGILCCLSRLLTSSFPFLTQELIDDEYQRIQQGSRSWQKIQRENRKKSNKSMNPMFDGVEEEDEEEGENEMNGGAGVTRSGRLDRNVLSGRDGAGGVSSRDGVLPIGGGTGRLDKSMLSAKSTASRKSSKSNFSFSDEWDEVTPSASEKLNSERPSVKKGNRMKNDDKDEEMRARMLSKVSFKSSLSFASFTSKRTAANPMANPNCSARIMSMESRVQMVECVIILFDTLMTENGNLFHCSSYASTCTTPGDFNLNQCGKLLDLCIGVTLMLKSQGAFLMPERADKVGDILHLLVQHLFELKLRYTVLEEDSRCTQLLCKTALKSTIAKVMARRHPSGLGGKDHSNDKETIDIEGIATKKDESSKKSMFDTILMKKPLDANNDFDMFAKNLDLHPPISYEKLQKTALFQVFKEYLHSTTEYLESGGPLLMDVDGNAVRDMGALRINGNTALTKLCAFDLWLNGGARFITRALGIISTQSYMTNSLPNSPADVANSLFHVFILLLQSNVEQIRKNTRNVKTRTGKVAAELERVQKSQNALHILGASTVVLRLLGHSYRVGKVQSLVSLTAPLALKFGSSLLLRNRATQNAIMDSYKSSLSSTSIQKAGHLLEVSLSISGICRLIKICRSHIDLVRIQGPSALSPVALTILLQLFGFCGTMCSGHNERSRHFFRDQDNTPGMGGKGGMGGQGGGGGSGGMGGTTQGDAQKRGNCDAVKEIANAVNSLLAAACSMMKYINNPHFNENIAPLIWEPIPNSARRRYISWHDQQTDYFALAQLIYTASVGFVCLTELCQGPCIENQKSILQAVTKCPALLEFLGVMQLDAVSTVGSTFFGVHRKLSLLGGHPSSFYRTILREIPPPDAIDDDSEWSQMIIACNEWQPSRTQLLLYGDRSEEGNNSNSEELLGIKLVLLKKISKNAELKCLRMILALLEATTDIVAVAIEKVIHEDIMLQNMQNMYGKAIKSVGKSAEHYRSAAVAYMTINMTLNSIPDRNSQPHTVQQSQCEQWLEKQTKDDSPNASLLASVEIIGADGRIQNVYFPVPCFVSMYWSYPEVQKAKELLIYKNNRESPEEKLADFYSGMDGIAKVMRRQKRLKVMLSPFLHALFGGKSLGRSVGLSRIIPPQRVIFFLITFFFNIYYSYCSYYGYSISHNTDDKNDDIATLMFPQFVNYFWFWNYRSLAILIIASTHFGLACSLALRGILNSRAADRLPDILPGRLLFKRESYAYSAFTKGMVVIQAPRTFIYLALDNIIPLLLCGCSGAALFAGRIWFYAPCLVDVLDQIRYMSFIVLAIRRNLLTISFTILLVVLFLYFFSVLNYLFFPNQYDLSGHMSCNDMGSCFKMHLDYGFNNPPNWAPSGYIQPEISGLNMGTELGILISKFTGTVYNLIYTILINLVLQAIVSGLIIDTFSSMRIENEIIGVDVKDKCFICSITRDEFEQAGVSFQDHINKQHNMWKYLWFKIYLESKDPLSYTGPEFYANSQFQDKLTFVRLLPVKRSLAMERIKNKINDMETPGKSTKAI